MIHRILIICVGNICRSPMAEILLRKHLGGGNEVVVESAGLAALVGNPVDPLAQRVLEDNGLSGEGHAARQVTPEMIGRADLVLAMQKRHVDAIHAISPQARGKTFLLGRWEGNCEVPDPYGKTLPVFEDNFRLIDRTVQAWRMHL
ncbi:low molecular weight phosphotyrosine protein phosphatase [Lysobacter sp. KIS68-7]|uniref:low molecular weight protein-tyrosine-phosphatase n=1 Tax=Lysobacter sp. KIS68-7 TaxID=2904252 RepID=UPI001E411E70|nr:low molecular weight protein-tyrosine-phosphatase [Lysobacter sp. KIS68-7]UHQ18582.1 low molecular weight phosphotyrosine protein phosphatase [Lysobacter sp. KIS68-7]